MLRFKFYNDTNKLESWLNQEADKGNICVHARPNFYLFHFRKINLQENENKRYLVEKCSFIKERNRNKYIQTSQDLGLSLINVIPKDGVLIFRGSQKALDEKNSRKKSTLSLAPMYLKSIFANTIAAFASFLALTHIEISITASTILLIIGSLSFISMVTSYIGFAIILLNKEKAVLVHEKVEG